VADREATLRETLDLFLLSLKKELLEAVRTELPAYKTQRNILFFDDLLIRLRDALQQPEGNLLAEAIRRKYRAALIDEFQDTDPVQYGILRTVFLQEHHSDVDNPPVFLIGDPKQAIYSFRGADIFAYMAAAKQVDISYTLRENWRSAPPRFLPRSTACFITTRTPSFMKPSPLRIRQRLRADCRKSYPCQQPTGWMKRPCSSGLFHQMMRAGEGSRCRKAA